MGFDLLGELPDDALLAGRAAGMVWTGAYLEVLTEAYRARLHAHGYAIAPLCEARLEELTSDVGDRTGGLELGRAYALGIPSGVHLTLDLEDTHGTPQGVVDYIDHASMKLVRGAYGGMLYVAEPEILSGDVLYARPSITCYWSGASDNPKIPVCGYSVFQGLPIEYAAPWAGGRKVDLDVVFADRRERTPMMWWPA